MSTTFTSDEINDLKTILAESHAEAKAADYAAAVASAQRAREKDPQNVYLLAFEKQLEQLAMLPSGNTLAEEARTDILDSLDGIIERAIAIAAGEETGEGSDHAAQAGATAEDRAAAREWLKSQYFQHAHKYVRKGEYDRALAEIRRVFVIDPSHETAREFETHILELKDFHRLIPEEAASPPRITPSRPSSGRSPSLRRGRGQAAGRRSTAVMVGIIALAMAFIGFALIYNWVRSSELKQQPAPVVIPQGEPYSGAPVEAPDTIRTPTDLRTSPQRPSQSGGADTTEPAPPAAEQSPTSEEPPPMP